MTSPVRFDACLATMRELGVTAVIELPPAGALAGLAKREWKGAGIEILALTGPADLDRARELIAAERGRAEAEHLPDWRVVVAPARGTVSPAEVAEGTRLPAGTPLGCIRSRREEVNVSAAYDGVLAEWLVHEGDLVDAGDPIARLYPEVTRMSTIQLPPGAPGARILGLGGYRPRRRVTNDELAETMDTNDEWIQARVGIAERRWARSDETLVEMSVAAGGKALAASGLDAGDIDLVLAGHHQPAEGDPRPRPAGRPPARHPAPGRLRPQRRLRRVVLRAQRGRRRDPRGLGPQRPGRSAASGSPTSPT